MDQRTQQFALEVSPAGGKRREQLAVDLAVDAECAAVSSTDRRTSNAEPPSNGRASAAGGSMSSRSSSSERKKEDAARSGWIAEQMSCL